MELLVNNTTSRILGYAVATPGNPGIARPRVLRPGVNKVDKREFDAACSLDVIKTLIENDEIKIEGELKNGSLADLDPKKAIKVAKECFDPEQLALWSKDEKRPDVWKALQSRERTLRDEFARRNNTEGDE